MSDTVWLYLLVGAYCLGIDTGLPPDGMGELRRAVWRTALLLLWPAVLAGGAVLLWRKRGEG